MLTYTVLLNLLRSRTSKADYNFEHVVTPTFYVAKWKWQAYPAGD